MPSDVHLLDRQSSHPRYHKPPRRGSMDESRPNGGGTASCSDAGQSVYMQRYQALREAGFDDSTANKYSPLYSSVNQVIDAILSQSLDDSLAVSGNHIRGRWKEPRWPPPEHCDEANSRCFDSAAAPEPLAGGLLVTMLKDGLLEDSSDEITMHEAEDPGGQHRSAASSLSSSGVSCSFFSPLDTASSSSPSSFSSLSSSMSMTPPNHYEPGPGAAELASGPFLSPPKQQHKPPQVGALPFGCKPAVLMETNDLSHLSETCPDTNLSCLIVSNHQSRTSHDLLKMLGSGTDNQEPSLSATSEHCSEHRGGTLSELLGYLNAQQSARPGSFFGFDGRAEGLFDAAVDLDESSPMFNQQHQSLRTFADIAAASSFGSPLLEHRKPVPGNFSEASMQSFYDGYSQQQQQQATPTSSKKFFAGKPPAAAAAGVEFRPAAAVSPLLQQQTGAAAAAVGFPQVEPEPSSAGPGPEQSNRPTNLMGYKGLWICNVAPEVTVHYLKRRFRRFGHFTSIQTFERRATNGTNIVFVHYDNPYSPMEAIAALHNYCGPDLCAEASEPLKLRFAPSMEQSRAGQLPTLEQARKVVEKNGECFNWRLSSGCHRGPRCHLKHVPINKEIDSQPWVKALKKKAHEA